MRKIPQHIKEQISVLPFYKECCRRWDSPCDGRITIEHTIIFAGHQIDDLWNLLPLCEYHHGVNKYQDGGDLQKEKNVWIALNRATDDELRSISKAIDYIKRRTYLNNKYGIKHIEG